jgi:LPXTG-motif cell wall-anchored protein
VKRLVTMALIAGVALSVALIGLVPAMTEAASAQTPPCFPGSITGDYPPATPGAETSLKVDLSTGLLLPGTNNGTLTVIGGIPGLTYCGTLFSTPVTASPTPATAAGVIDFANMLIPGNFQLNVVHHLDVYRAGGLVGAFDFCVNSSGHLVSASSCGGGAAVKGEGALPRTGLARLAELLKAAGIAFAAGVLFLYLRRRRAANLPPA